LCGHKTAGDTSCNCNTLGARVHIRPAKYEQQREINGKRFSMAESYDLITVGGGLGAAALARSIADKGARVLVIEREEKFKDRVRGEMLVPWGVAEAEGLGIAALLRGSCGHDLRWVDFFSGSHLVVHRDTVATTPHQQPGLTFYHPAMQEALLGAAEKAGAEVRRGVCVQEVRPGTTPSVVTQRSGHTEEVCARMVVGADGRSSVASRSAGFQTTRDPDRMLLAGVLLENCPAAEDTGRIVIDSETGSCAVIFPQGGGRARAYLAYHKDSRPRILGDGAFANFIECCKRTGADPGWYDGARAAGPLASFDGADTDTPHPYRNGVALVGDAAATSDPSWGQGLATTLRDARLLRDQLLANDDWDAAGHAYAEEHDRYCMKVHEVVGWYTDFFLETGPEASARRARAYPLIAQDPGRQPDLLFSGPDMPVDNETRRRFFGED
jgi:2-polyprenyl-6-methoxyphenol hydroxylase-like FAD-dependent oxidoreductase